MGGVDGDAAACGGGSGVDMTGVALVAALPLVPFSLVGAGVVAIVVVVEVLDCGGWQ